MEIKQDTEVSILSDPHFQRLFRYTVHLDHIDDDGAELTNQFGEFLHVSPQKICSDFIKRGISLDDERFIEKGVKAIEYGFRQCNSDGTFNNNIWGIDMYDVNAMEDNIEFIQAASHSYLMLKNSHFSDYCSSMEEFKNGIGRAMYYIAPKEKALVSQANDFPERLLYDALAFASGFIFMDDLDIGFVTRKEDGALSLTKGTRSSLMRTRSLCFSLRFSKENMKRQRDDGSWITLGGFDSSYQAVNLLKAQEIFIYSHYSQLSRDSKLNIELRESIDRGIEWEKSKVLFSGEVVSENNRRSELIDYPTVIASFLYHWKLTDDNESLCMANKIMDHYVSISQ